MYVLSLYDRKKSETFKHNDMTQKEKAKELVERFLIELPNGDDIGFGQPKIAKQCALICVDEIMDELDELQGFLGLKLYAKKLVYWQEVKQEIKKI